MIINNNETIPYDILLEGGTDSQGNIKEVFGVEAIQNSIRMWLVSYKNECIRGSYIGGYVTQWLVKPMSIVASEEMEHSIRDGFAQDFSPVAELRGLQVVADYENKRWRIMLFIYIPQYKLTTDLDVYIKNQYIQ